MARKKDDLEREAFGCDIGNGFGSIAELFDPAKDSQLMLTSAKDLNPKVGMPTDAYVTPPDAKPIWVYDPLEGSARRRQILRDPANSVRAIKTQLRQDHLNLPGVNVPVSPYDVYGAVARDLVRLGNQQRISDGRSPIYDLVFTYPAAFTQYPDEVTVLNRMQESIENVTLDNHHLKVIGRLPEPAAAAIDYLHYLQDNAPDKKSDLDEFTVLVFDLGHGTFDLSVVTARSKGEPYQVWANSGLPEDCGGRDFTRRLYDEAVDLLLQEDYKLQNAHDEEMLLREVEDAKHTLSDAEEAAIEHLKIGEGTYASMTITRSRFEELTQDMLASMLIKVQDMLDEQSASGRKVDAVILVGGGCHMPMIQNGLKQLLGDSMPVYKFRPSTAVSFGAARYAYSLDHPIPDPTKNNNECGETRTPQEGQPFVEFHAECTYGVLDENSSSLAGEIRQLIPKGTVLPASASLPGVFYTSGGYKSCRILRLRNGQQLSTDPTNWEDIVWLHFDIPNDHYQFSITVEKDRNITVALKGSNGTTYTRSTKES